MFRLTNLRRKASILTVSTLVATSAAYAQSDNVSVDRGLNEDTGNYEMSRSITVDSGGSVTTQRVCGAGETEGMNGCVRVKTFTGADGQTATKEQLIIQGPHRTRALSRSTNANGDQRRFLRRWRN